MDDKRLEDMLMQAHDLSAFEQELGLEPEAPAMPLRLHRDAGNLAARVASRDSAHRMAWMGPLVGVAGLAAAIAIAFVTVRPAPQPKPNHNLAQNTQPSHGTPMPAENHASTNKPREDPHIAILKPVDPKASGDAPQNMVLAMYEGTDPKTGNACDNCECVQWWSHDWGTGRDVADIRPGELIGASMEHACMPTPRRVVVVGLTGPAAALPDTDTEARDLVNCIMGREEEHRCADREASVATAASYCLPSGVAVRVQTWDR